MHAEITYFKTHAGYARQRQRVELIVFNVDYFLATHADEVVMAMDQGVIARGGAGVTGFRDRAGANECFEHAIYRRSRHAGQSVAHRLIYSVGSGMITAIRDGREDHAALRRERQSSRAAEVFERIVVDAPAFRLSRLHTKW